MLRYWRIYRTFFVSSLAREMEFRANFFAKVGRNAVWTGFFLIILLVIYSKADNVAGWTRGEAFLLAGTVFIVESTLRGFFWSLLEIPEAVRKGTLDFVVTKPVDTQFWISTRRFNFDELGVGLAGLAMLILGVVQSGITPSPWQWLAYLIATACAQLIFYGFNLLLMTLAIWFVRVDNLWVLSDSMIQIARYPTDIYSFFVRKIFVWALPLTFLATVPASQLRTGVDPWMLVHALAWTVFALVTSRLFWQYALRSYGSASS